MQSQGTDERRLETRLTRQDRVFVEVVAATPDDPCGGEFLACETLDVSANGIQVLMNQPLMLGCILPLYIESAQDNRRFSLTAEVRWVRPAETDGQFQVGFMLFESDETSILEWKQSVAGLLETDDGDNQ